MAGGLGFEPRLDESESSVLPLDDPPVLLPNIPHPPGKSKGDFSLKLTGAHQIFALPLPVIDKAGCTKQIVAQPIQEWQDVLLQSFMVEG